MAKILIVDDQKYVMSVLRDILGTTENVLFEAENGKDCMEIFEKEDPEIVFMDIFLPDSTGIDLIRTMRKLKPDIKIIAMTGGGNYTKFDVLNMAVGAGANYTLSKPFDRKKVHDLLSDMTK